MTRHSDQQYRCRQALLTRILDHFASAKISHPTQDAFCDGLNAIRATEKRLTQTRMEYVRGFTDALHMQQNRALIFLYRIIDTNNVFPADWGNMTEEQKEACRTNKTESCLSWDSVGKRPYGPWRKD